MTIDEKASVITRVGIQIVAPTDTVWTIFTDVARWTTWNRAIDRAALDGPIAVGSAIHWATAGMDIVSTIGELIPHRRLVWSGTSNGIVGIHHWQFTPVEGGTLVQTEESWAGEPVEQQVEAMQRGLDESLRAWLESLKLETERNYRAIDLWVHSTY